MANFVGKWVEASQENIPEFYAAIGVSDPAPKSDKASFEWTQAEDGTWTEVFDAGTGNITTRTFQSGVANADQTLTTIEGETITGKEVVGDATINYQRVLSGNTITTTITSEKTDIVATLVLEKA